MNKKIKEVIVVEGTSDVQTLSNIIDADFIITHGSAISKDTLDCIKSDFIHYIFEDFFYNILSELGFYDGIDEYPNTDTQIILVEEISNIVKVELRKKLEREWN